MSADLPETRDTPPQTLRKQVVELRNYLLLPEKFAQDHKADPQVRFTLSCVSRTTSTTSEHQMLTKLKDPSTIDKNRELGTQNVLETIFSRETKFASKNKNGCQYLMR